MQVYEVRTLLGVEECDFALLHPLELDRTARDYQDYWSLGCSVETSCRVLKNHRYSSTMCLPKGTASSRVSFRGRRTCSRESSKAWAGEPPDLGFHVGAGSVVTRGLDWHFCRGSRPASFGPRFRT